MSETSPYLETCRTFYADPHGNFGAMRRLESRPFTRVAEAFYDLGTGIAVNKSVPMSHILSTKGWKPNIHGVEISFKIDVLPPSSVCGIEYEGHILDIVGKNENDEDVFVVNEERHYRVFKKSPCTHIFARTKVLKHDDPPIFVRPFFSVYDKIVNEDIIPVANRIKAMATDVELVLPSGKTHPYHSVILRASSEFFEQLLSDKFNTPERIELKDFSDDLWLLALDFMYETSIRKSQVTIEQLLDLCVLGDKFLVFQLVSVAVRVLCTMLEDDYCHFVKPYLISMMSLVLFFDGKEPDCIVKADMQGLWLGVTEYIRTHWHDFIDCEDFLIEYANVCKEAKLHELKASTTRFALLGKRRWDSV